MPPGKSPGPDNIPYKPIRHDGLPLKSCLFSLILRMWESKQVPKDLKDTVVITIFKEGNQKAWRKYRGISLLSTDGKILTWILLNRLEVARCCRGNLPMASNKTVAPSTSVPGKYKKRAQSSRNYYSLYFMIWRKLLKKSQEQPCGWSSKDSEDFEHFVSLVHPLHEGMSGCMFHGNRLIEEFPITSGLRQGCYLAPTLFSLYLATMLHDILPDDPGVDIQFHLDRAIVKSLKTPITLDIPAPDPSQSSNMQMTMLPPTILLMT